MKSSASKSPANLLVALEFAAHKHRDQRRKDAAASPYINHPIALARRREYFDWAKAVVDALPPVSKELRRAFDAAHAARP